MKILFYIHQLCIGGAETIVTNYLIALKRIGIDVALVEIESSDSFLDKQLNEEGIRVLSLYPTCNDSFCGKVKRKITRNATNIKRRWSEIVQQEKPDIIHSHTAVTLFEKLDFPASRIVCSIHTDIERNIRVVGEKNHMILKQLAKNGVVFFSLSDKMTADIQRYYETTRTIYVPNGFDFKKIRANRYDKKVFLQEIGIPEDAFIIGHVGRFHPVKNHQRLIEIFCEVKKIKPKACLMLIGGGTLKEIQVVSELISKYNLTESVIMLGLREDATAIMSVFDAFVLPSTYEGFPLALMEAQAQGVRCVVSNVVPEAAVCNSNCYSVSLNATNKEWARIILSDSRRDNESNIEVFDMQNVVSHMCSEYKRIIAGEYE